MSEINKVLGTHGPGVECTIPVEGGEPVTYVFHPLDYYREAEYEEWLESRARDACDRTVAHLTKRAETLRHQAGQSTDQEASRKMMREAAQLEHKAASRYDELEDKITAGEFSFASEISVRAMDSLPGLVKLVSLMLQVKQPNIANETVKDLILNHQVEIMKAVRRANDLGKPIPPSSNGTTTPV